MSYNGKYVHTITGEDVTDLMNIHKRTEGRVRYFQLKEVMGQVLPGDVGKQIWVTKDNAGVKDVYHVESDKQRDARVAREEGVLVDNLIPLLCGDCCGGCHHYLESADSCSTFDRLKRAYKTGIGHVLSRAVTDGYLSNVNGKHGVHIPDELYKELTKERDSWKTG